MQYINTNADAILSLDYFGGYRNWTIPIFMTRNVDSNYGKPETTFCVHVAATGEIIGAGDEKAEAISDARARLAEWAERQAYRMGVIDRPYGRRVYAAS